MDNLLIELGKIQFIESFGRGQAGTQEKDGREAEEMILRFFSMRSDMSDYEDVLSKYLDRFMISNQNISEHEIADLKSEFTTTLNRCMSVFDNNPFVDLTKEKPKQSLVHYDLLMWSFKSLTDEFTIANKLLIAEKFRNLCTDDRFVRTLSGGLQKKSSILKRRELWLEKLATING